MVSEQLWKSSLLTTFGPTGEEAISVSRAVTLANRYSRWKRSPGSKAKYGA